MEDEHLRRRISLKQYEVQMSGACHIRDKLETNMVFPC